MIFKYIKAALVILIGGAAYFFVLGKSNEPAVDQEYINQLFDTYEEVAATGDFETYATINQLAERESHILSVIYTIESHQTMYNRFFSKEHYYEDAELAAIKKRFEHVENSTIQAVEQYLAPRINFTKVLSGEIDDPNIKIDLDGSDYVIDIKGQMKPSSTIVYWPLYHIDTTHGSYFFKEPDYTSATLMDNIQYAFRGDTVYTFNIEPQ